MARTYSVWSLFIHIIENHHIQDMQVVFNHFTLLAVCVLSKYALAFEKELFDKTLRAAFEMLDCSAIT